MSAASAQLGSLRRSLAEGRPALGYLITTPSVQIVQALARTGVDWLMLDTEHAPVSIDSVAAMVAATGGTPATPIVRVPAARPELVKPVLDCGALWRGVPADRKPSGGRGRGEGDSRLMAVRI